MKKLLLLAIAAGVVIFSYSAANAQSYDHAIGVRLGQYNGVNFKTFLTDKNALDFNLSFRSHSDVKDVRLTGLYELHNPIEGVAGLRWYYGAGASIGSYKFRNADGVLFLSADGVLGLDYKFADAPINLALDWRPRLDLTPDTGVSAGDVGLAIRFTF